MSYSAKGGIKSIPEIIRDHKGDSLRAVFDTAKENIVVGRKEDLEKRLEILSGKIDHMDKIKGEYEKYYMYKEKLPEDCIEIIKNYEKAYKNIFSEVKKRIKSETRGREENKMQETFKERISEIGDEAQEYLFKIKKNNGLTKEDDSLLYDLKKNLDVFKSQGLDYFPDFQKASLILNRINQINGREGLE